ncbi:MAG: gliding motility-associated C-terminal domain-containing protein [Bacteroidales bacterium]|nr:gliding motility-associated C-terminal domain-containing protein [Bacteroidales bacterium]MBN2698561.1 gliding motility-associated C-terminal domain-containing protein [Bacteroidales bacterium]
MPKSRLLNILAVFSLLVPFFSLSAQEVVITSISATPVTCGGASDGTITVTVTGGVPPYQYGLIQEFIYVETSEITYNTTYTYTGHEKYNSYIVVVRDSDPNTSHGFVSNYPIGGPDPIAITSHIAEDMSCTGVEDGVITVTATGEDGNYLFDLTGPVSEQNTTGIFPGLPEGNYTVTVSHNGSCTSTDVTPTLTINNPSTLSISLDNVVPATCFGGFSGSIGITPSGGTPSGSGTGYTYFWTGPNGFTSTDEDIINIQSGNYSVTVYDGNMCAATAGPVFVPEPSQITVILNNSSNLTCNGGNDGSVAITAGGGTPPYTFFWEGQSTGFTTAAEDPSSLPADKYDLTITDGNSCSRIFPDFLTIEEPPAITVKVDGTTDATCFGESDGSAFISTSGGTPGYSFLWSGSTSGYSDTGEDPENMPADTYSVTLTDAAGCIVIFNDLLTINEPAQINVTVNGTSNVTCNGDSDGSADITVTGGTPGYTFLWTGIVSAHTSTMEDPDDLVADAYDLLITDSNGCTRVFNNLLTISEPEIISVSIDNIADVACYGDETGAINITPAGGTPVYTYVWSGPDGFSQTSQDIANLAAGTYSLTITDARGCKGTFNDLATVGEAAEIISTFILNNISCNGFSDGTIDVTVSGGTPPYDFSWTGPSGFTATTGDISNLSPGDYELTITDNAECTRVFPVQTLTEPLPITIATSVLNIRCFGAADGSINLTISGGTPPYTCFWIGPNGFTSPDEDISNLGPGNYSVTVTDLNSCTQLFENAATIIEPAEISVNVTKTDISCNGLNDGSISITLSGGTSPYDFIWTGPPGYNSSQQNISGLGAGTYNLTITDGNSCVNNFPGLATIIDPDPLQAVLISHTNVSCYGGSDGSIEINVFGGTAPLAFNWTSSSGTTLSSDEDPSFLPADTYSLEITDVNDCSVSYPGFVTIGEPPALSISLSKTDIDCYGDADGTITITASGGTGTYQYSRFGNSDPSYQNENTFTNLPPGTYTLWVRDANLCVLSDTISIYQPNEILIQDESVTGEILCYGDGTMQISINLVSGGVEPYEYSIDGGLNFYASGVFPNLTAGNYQTTIRDANGCQVSGELHVITQPDELIIDSYNQLNVTTCYDSPEGLVSITGTGGVGQLSYTLDESVTNLTGDFQNLLAGNYSIVIEDLNECTKDTLITILSPPAVVVSNASVTDVTGCSGDATGSLEVTGAGGTGNITYSLDGAPFVTSGTFTSLPAGSYRVTLKDDNDCTIDTLLTISEPGPLVIDNVAADNITCSGSNDGLIQVTVSGGTLPLLYTLNPVGTINSTGIFQNLAAGEYSVEVDDSRGCGPLTYSGIVISEPPSLLIDSAKHKVISCNGAKDGEIHIYLSGGTPPYEYSIDNRASYSTSGDFTGLGPGNYEVYASDRSGCEVYAGTYLFTDPPVLSLEITVTDVTPCHGNANGTISINATGGTGMKIYSIDGLNYQGSGDFLNLDAGPYMIYVVDEAGCTLSEQVNIDEPEAVTASIEKTDAIYGNLGTITFSATSGGTAPYEYSINGPEGPFTASTFYEDLPAGFYYAMVKDVNDCLYEEMIEILDVPPLTVTVNTTDVLCYGDDNGTIEFVPQDATGEVQYSIDGGDSFETVPLFDNLEGGRSYDLVALDEEGKVFRSSVFIFEPDRINISRTVSPAECNVFSETGSISVSVTGGTGPYSYLWSNGSSSQELDHVVAGTYTVQVTDENGCVVSEDIFIGSLITVNADAGKDTTICPGSPVQLEGRGGTDFSWTPSEYFSDPFSSNPVAEGMTEEVNFILTVAEESSPYGCYDIDTVNVSFYPLTGLLASADTFMIRGTSVQLHAEGGPFESYLWEPAAGLSNNAIPDPIASPLLSVMYTVSAVNEYGCEENDSVFVEVLENIKVYNVFTPNDDGKNDFFEIEDAYRFPEMIVEVYSRWGDLLFSSKGYTDDKRWDGTARGKDVPAGTYYYVVIPSSGVKPITGNVTIIR